MNKILTTLTIVLTIALGLMYTKVNKQTIRPGAAQYPTASVLATSSTVAVGPSLNRQTLFTANTVCISRVISTGGNAILLSFDTATTSSNPGPNIGFIQSASTTVAYDSSIYGCSQVSAYGYAASTTVTIAEFR